MVDKAKFTLDNIISLSKSVSENSIILYEELPQYDLFLSQVIDYLNDKFDADNYTNNIVQNYIKGGVISKPEDSKKRGYTKLHLAQLVLLSYMRPILTSEEIKKVFRLAFNEINDRDDDIISWEKAYKIFSDMQKESLNHFVENQFCDKSKLQSIINALDLKESDEERITVFLVVMTLVSQASAIKKLIRKIVDDYEN
ncbi:DUF1836 domain-containing protein [Clostridium sp. CM028]|uniref:DUF1836 domain-containing protein n=1 Tax=unclassified Clostridium TaxID=2614128 RepID=UPI001C0C4F18|nr:MULTISPECIES: DUF1836 domain-containing protein [unclassified Clostridium]MBU3092489.1 DUF1836 domain-containing protein [Clostridium sp. CF011]MBW9146394.1 DUF1836 domain-containing protein [Clostridium sp. CM027]MBW9150005.1 DUF1836 domain-containing protein [Clostridium sp. CM028]UVE39904.1 DUF1836 domain-containing protein [Clostridium sp. CM027]WAG68820.1 DUF1836 domain-containing protein [Clostridium sp. CF011]